MDKIDLKHLLDKYRTGSCNPEELALLENWYLQWQVEPEEFTGTDLLVGKYRVWEEVSKELEPGHAVTLPERRKGRVLVATISAVAAAIILVIGGLFYFGPNDKPAKNSINTSANAILPGSEGAVLTLANGQQIRLNDVKNGQLANEAGVVISKSRDGVLTYEIKNGNGDPSSMNTLTTSKGETFKIRLPDGSLAWLNAASGLTYQANLGVTGKRTVQLSGEGYFEIAEDKSRPFVVNTALQQVQVLGTHFNINSYANEKMTRTTLLEGSVRVTSVTGIGSLLKPNQEAAVNSAGDVKIKPADPEIATAWRKKQLLFEGVDIGYIMRMVQRWYDVEVVYQGNEITSTFSGGVSKLNNLSEVLKSIESTGKVHFKVEGRKVYVSQ